jgi:hypothetical protein
MVLPKHQKTIYRLIGEPLAAINGASQEVLLVVDLMDEYTLQSTQRI